MTAVFPQSYSRGPAADVWGNPSNEPRVGPLSVGRDAVAPGRFMPRDVQEEVDMYGSFFGPTKLDNPNIGRWYNSSDLETFPDAFQRPGGDMLPDMTHIVITQLSEADNVWTREILPLRQREDSLEWYSNEMRFDDHELDVEPYLTVPRYVTFRERAQGHTMTRYGKAIHMEYDFYNTRKGVVRWVFGLVQIANAVKETFNLAAAAAILKTTQSNSSAQWESAHMGRVRYVELMREQRTSTFALQKTRNGVGFVFSKAADKLSMRGNQANLVIMPEGSARYVRMRELAVQEMNGGAKRTPVLSDQQGIPRVSEDLNGCRVVMSRRFHVNENGEHPDPFFELIVFGSFAFADAAPFSHMNAQKTPYVTDQRCIIVNSLQAQDDVRLHVIDWLRHCHLFHDRDDRSLTRMGNEFFSEDKDLQDYLENVGFDSTVKTQLRDHYRDLPDIARECGVVDFQKRPKAERAAKRAAAAAGSGASSASVTAATTAATTAGVVGVTGSGGSGGGGGGGGGGAVNKRSVRVRHQLGSKNNQPAAKPGNPVAPAGPPGQQGNQAANVDDLTFLAGDDPITAEDAKKIAQFLHSRGVRIAPDDAHTAATDRVFPGIVQVALIHAFGRPDYKTSGAGELMELQTGSYQYNHARYDTTAKVEVWVPDKFKGTAKAVAAELGGAVSGWPNTTLSATSQELDAIGNGLNDLATALSSTDQWERKMYQFYLEKIKATWTKGAGFRVRVSTDSKEQAQVERDRVFKSMRKHTPQACTLARARLVELLATGEEEKAAKLARVLEFLLTKDRSGRDDAVVAAIVARPDFKDTDLDSYFEFTTEDAIELIRSANSVFWLDDDSRANLTNAYDARTDADAEFVDSGDEKDEALAWIPSEHKAAMPNQDQIIDAIMALPPGFFGKVFFTFAKYSIAVPLSALLTRPFQQFDAGTMVVLDKRGLGHSYYGGAGFSMEPDAKQRVIYGHFVIRHGAVVENADKVELLHHVYCRPEGYRSGRGTRFFSTMDFINFRQTGETNDCSILVIPIRPGWRPVDQEFINLVGSDPPHITGEPIEKQTPHYPGCEIWARFFKFEHPTSNPWESSGEVAPVQRNTICWQDWQRTYNPSTGDWTEQLNKGHLGLTYRDCAAVWRGQVEHLREHTHTVQLTSTMS